MSEAPEPLVTRREATERVSEALAEGYQQGRAAAFAEAAALAEQQAAAFRSLVRPRRFDAKFTADEMMAAALENHARGLRSLGAEEPGRKREGE